LWDVSTSYVQTGRTAQKQRTQQALVAAARELIAAGAAPTVDAAAAAAGIARATAYRYFPTQLALLGAAHPETATPSLLPEDAPVDDVGRRLDLVVTAFTQLIADTEAQQRTMLRLSLEPGPAEPSDLPLRNGRAITWIAEALEPLRGQLADVQLERLVLAIRSAIGIEARVWLTDVAGLSAEDALATMRWSAQAMLQAARQDNPPPEGPSDFRAPAPGPTKQWAEGPSEGGKARG
jgi:AcrR family transcriptional regulator